MDIFGSALRLTCTGSYRIVQRCFSERTSRLRGYFKNIQFRLFIRLVWRPDDTPHDYGSLGIQNFIFKANGAFWVRPTLLPTCIGSLGLFSLVGEAPYSLFTSCLTLLDSHSLLKLVPHHYRHRRAPPPPPSLHTS